MNLIRLLVVGGAAATFAICTSAAPAPVGAKPQPTTQAVDPSDKQAADIVASLKIDDPVKAARVHGVIAEFTRKVRDWHNSQLEAFTAANPATKPSIQKMTDMDGKLPREIHTQFVDGLAANLTPDQAEAVKDKLTEGKVQFTLRGYHSIVPDLTAEEESHILGLLKQAREEALDVKGAKEMSAVFEVYKTQAENYLNSNGRNWKQLYKDFVNAQKAKKSAASKPAAK